MKKTKKPNVKKAKTTQSSNAGKGKPKKGKPASNYFFGEIQRFESFPFDVYGE